MSQLRTAPAVWEKLCSTRDGPTQIKSRRKDSYNRQYQTFSQKSGESLDDCFAHFESIVSKLRACDDLAYSDNEMAKQLLFSLNDKIWGVKISALEEIADFDTLDCDALFSKLKSHELSKKSRPYHDNDMPSSSRALVSKSHIGDDDNCFAANPSHGKSSWEMALSSFIAATDKQIETILDDELALLARKFKRVYKYKKERRGGRSRGCFECGDVNHFIADCPKRKNKFDYSNKNDYNKSDYNKNDYKKKSRFGDKKKRDFKKIMSRACAALSDIDFSSEDSSSSEEDEKVKSKKKAGDFTGLCHMAKGRTS